MLQIIRAIMKDKDDGTVCQLLFANQVISVLICVYEVLFNKHNSANEVLAEKARCGNTYCEGRGEQSC